MFGAESQTAAVVAPVEALVAEALLPAPPTVRRRATSWVRVVGAMVILLIAGNLGLLALTGAARALVDHPATPSIAGVGSLRTVDDKVLRGANPTHAGYENLRDAGVTTVVDLRAEVDAHADDEFIRSLGMEVVHLPIRDGQTPSGEQQAAFADIVRKAPGTVFLHCGAGVGRTGVVAARYLVESGQTSPLGALGRNLEVGPPSVEQNAYSLGVDFGVFHPFVVAVSRFLDSPRRILHYL